jgi:hypothetical protein
MTTKAPFWILLIVQLPGRNPTLRMQIWRALTASGAEQLRDGAYVLPNSIKARATFDAQALKLIGAGGVSYVVPFEAESAVQQKTLLALFDRASQYADVIDQLHGSMRSLTKPRESAARRAIAAAQREASAIAAKDFFPGRPLQQMNAVLADAQAAFNARFVPDEPHASRQTIRVLDRKQYQGKQWATRERMWVDRVASAWLIRRFIDPNAKFVWLKSAKSRGKQTVGFDFDGAEFTHVGAKVTFEVLIASFALKNIGLVRLGALVHYLDVGGIPVAEGPGIIAIMTGARLQGVNDDALLQMMTPVLDSLYAAYSKASGSGAS